jgi:hypothetical protein
MQPRTRRRRFVYAVLVAVVACVIILSSGAMGGYFRSMDSGQPRELVNRPTCWTVENHDDISRCELND